MKLSKRLKKPVPKFFRVVRTVGVCLIAAGGTLVAPGVAVPLIIKSIAGYLIVAGGVATAVAQSSVHIEPDADYDDILNHSDENLR